MPGTKVMGAGPNLPQTETLPAPAGAPAAPSVGSSCIGGLPEVSVEEPPCSLHRTSLASVLLHLHTVALWPAPGPGGPVPLGVPISFLGEQKPPLQPEAQLFQPTPSASTSLQAPLSKTFKCATFPLMKKDASFWVECVDSYVLAINECFPYQLLQNLENPRRFKSD